MKSLPHSGSSSANCRLRKHSLHNLCMSRVWRVTCAVALLLTFVSPSLSMAAQTGSVASAKYPRYRMVMLRTLGGPKGGPFIPAVNLNDRGEVIAQADTTMQDPTNPFSDDGGFITHGILSDATGIAR